LRAHIHALVVDPDAGRALCRAAILRYVHLEARDEFEWEVEARRNEVAAEVARLMREAE